MIVTSLDPKHGNASLIPESADDLWTLRRLVEPGDTIVTRSSRVVKNQGEYTRPDRGERVRVTVSLVVDAVSLDRGVGRLRIRGRIEQATDEQVSKAGGHSISITPDHGLTIRKRNWGQLHTDVLRSAREVSKRFLLVAVDRGEAGIGALGGSHLSLITTVESGASGKREKEVSTEPFLRKAAQVVKAEWREGTSVVVAGPGHTKSALGNLLSSEKELAGHVSVIDGFDLAGADGVRSLIKFPGFQKVAADSVLVQVQGVVTEAVRRISMLDARVAYTLPRVREAAVLGSVEQCVASDEVFSHGIDEEEVVSVFNLLESKRGKVHLVDSSLELGKQVSSFGGIIALLRYAVRA